MAKLSLQNNFNWRDCQEVESVDKNFYTDVSRLSDEEIEVELEKIKRTARIRIVFY
jgi:NADPH-dependent 7-cyano-7-deazaguanine reductase QueF-like protein